MRAGADAIPSAVLPVSGHESRHPALLNTSPAGARGTSSGPTRRHLLTQGNGALLPRHLDAQIGNRTQNHKPIKLSLQTPEVVALGRPCIPKTMNRNTCHQSKQLPTRETASPNLDQTPSPTTTSYLTKGLRIVAQVYCLLLTGELLHAGQFGLFSYRDNGDGSLEITRYAWPWDAEGDVVIPAQIEGKPVTRIGRFAFEERSEVTSVTIPASVTVIDYSAFADCTGLTNLTIPGSVTNIGDWAFAGCTGLTSLTIAEGVTSIGKSAFSRCAGLITVTLPASTSSVDTSPFYSCTGLTAIDVAPGNADYTSEGGVLFNSSKTQIIQYPPGKEGAYGIPSGVTEISNAFTNCTGLTDITFPESLHEIGWAAFAGCTGLTTLAIPESVTSIGYKAFARCSGLTDVSIPESVTEIEGGAFLECTSLARMAIPGTVTQLYDTFRGCTGLTSVTLGDGVQYVGYQTFFDCTSLTGVTMPASLVSIDKQAFYECTSLSSIAIPNSVNWIGESAFWGCAGLASVEIPASVETIYRSAFARCTGLTRVTISEGVTEVRAQAFAECTSLTSIAIPPSVTSIGSSAFHRCTALTNVSLPESVTSIGNYALADCTGLTSVIIPGSIARIEVSMFENCTGLTSVTISDGVAEIASGAFFQCTALASITFPASVTHIEWEAFYGCSSLERAVFLGDAPVLEHWYDYLWISDDEFWEGEIFPFDQTAPGFTVYHHTDSTGFTSPRWPARPDYDTDHPGYPTAILGETSDPREEWLASLGLPADTALDQDLNGDGVALLAAYALSLDPRKNLAGSLPRPVLDETHLSLRFYGNAPGITYRVETSTNLRDWSTTGVSITSPDPDGTRQALVPCDGTRRFLRLVIQ